MLHFCFNSHVYDVRATSTWKLGWEKAKRWMKLNDTSYKNELRKQSTYYTISFSFNWIIKSPGSINSTFIIPLNNLEFQLCYNIRHLHCFTLVPPTSALLHISFSICHQENACFRLASWLGKWVRYTNGIQFIVIEKAILLSS